MLIYFKNKIIETSEIRYAHVVVYPARPYIEINFKEGNDRMLIGCETKEDAEKGIKELSELINSK